MARSTRRSRPSASSAPSSASSTAPDRLPPAIAASARASCCASSASCSSRARSWRRTPTPGTGCAMARRASTRRCSSALEELLADAEGAVTMPREFIVPGASRLSAGAGGQPHGRPPRGAAGHRARPRAPRAGRLDHALPEPARGPALGARPRSPSRPRRQGRRRAALVPGDLALDPDAREAEARARSRRSSRRSRPVLGRADRLPAPVRGDRPERGLVTSQHDELRRLLVARRCLSSCRSNWTRPAMPASTACRATTVARSRYRFETLKTIEAVRARACPGRGASPPA